MKEALLHIKLPTWAVRLSPVRRSIEPRPRHLLRGLMLLWVVTSAFGHLACIRALPGEDPPASGRLYYPGRMALSADGRTAFVVNLNFDQRFNTSWLTSVDVPALIDLAKRNESPLPALTQGLHVPGLGGDLTFGPTGTRAYLAHRGAGLLTVLDVHDDGTGRTTLSCGAPDGPEGLSHFEAHTDCDLDHLMRLKDAVMAADGKNTDPNERQYDDPYAIAVAPTGDGNAAAVMVGYLGAGRISVLTDEGQGLPKVTGYIKTPARGVSRLLATDEGLLFAASRASNLRQMDADSLKSFVVGVDLRDPDTGKISLAKTANIGGLPSKSYALSSALGGLSRTQPSGISGLLSPPGNPSELFVLSQQPDAVTLLDVSRPPVTASQEDGTVAVSYPDLSFALMGAEAVAHSTLSDVVYVPRATTDVVVVTSLVQDTLYFFDPTLDDLQLTHRIALKQGQGPVGLLHVQVEGRDYLLVSTFFDHGLTVIDISATHFADFKVLASIHDDTFPVAPRSR